jgi:predicted deacylase
MMYLDQCSDDATRAKTRAMADAFGFTPVDMIRDAEAHNTAILGTTSNYPTAIVNAHGVPGIMVELTHHSTTRDSHLGAGGIVNVMRALGMLEGEPDPQACGRLEGEYEYWGALMADVAGLLWVRRAPGELLDAGETILEIGDAWGNTLQEIAMPTRGFAWGFLGGLYGAGSHAIPEGTMVGFVAQKTG